MEIEETFGRGDALSMEDDQSQGEYLYQDEIVETIRNSHLQLDLVFCYSVTVAAIFLRTGATYVIIVNQAKELEE